MEKDRLLKGKEKKVCQYRTTEDEPVLIPLNETIFTLTTLTDMSLDLLPTHIKIATRVSCYGLNQVRLDTHLSLLYCPDYDHLLPKIKLT